MSEKYSRRIFLASGAGAAAVLAAGCAGGSPAPFVASSSVAPDAVGTTTRAASGRKGVQAVFLSYWSPASVDQFLSVFKDSSSGRFSRMPDGFEIAFLPYDQLQPAPPTKFENARRIIDSLSQSGKSIYCTVHLSLHAAGSSFDAQIKNNANDLYANFLSSYAGKAHFAVSPSLEDKGSGDDFIRWAGIIATAITDPNIRKNVTLRRSGPAAPATPSDSKFAKVETEYHLGNVSPSSPFSNDGEMVFWPAGNEDANSLSGSAGTPVDLPTFISQTTGNSGVVLLWRPPYNMEVRQVVGGRIQYSEGNKDLYDKTLVFNSVEHDVLKYFLGL